MTRAIEHAGFCKLVIMLDMLEVDLPLQTLWLVIFAVIYSQGHLNVYSYVVID